MKIPPLQGCRIVVTRAASQADALAAAFAAQGADVALMPLIEITPPADPHKLEQAAGHAASYDWLVFSSANAVRALLPRIATRLRSRLRVAVIGPATGKALRAYGIDPSIVARTPSGEGLLELLKPLISGTDRVLLPRAQDARRSLARGLRATGAEVTEVIAYGKRLPGRAGSTAQKLFSETPIGWVTCTSPRIARHFAGLFARDWRHRRRQMKAVSIGPITSAELRQLGVEPAAEALHPSDAAIVQAAVEAYRRFIPLSPDRGEA